MNRPNSTPRTFRVGVTVRGRGHTEREVTASSRTEAETVARLAEARELGVPVESVSAWWL
jgi:hypothetical protein